MFNLMQKAQSVLSNYDPSSDPNAGLPDGDYQAIITDVLVDVREGDNEKPIYRDGVDTGETEEATVVTIEFQTTARLDDVQGDAGIGYVQAKRFTFSDSTAESSVEKSLKTLSHLHFALSGKELPLQVFNDATTLRDVLAQALGGKTVKVQAYRRRGEEKTQRVPFITIETIEGEQPAPAPAAAPQQPELVPPQTEEPAPADDSVAQFFNQQFGVK